eukprot:m.50357 g.50357  ORF g.50357 m.50357 type:complete len:475 (-) comp10665_c1_seq1:134-1558(-)
MRLSLLLLLLLTQQCVSQSATIVEENGNVIIELIEGSKAFLRTVDATGTPTDVPIATMDDLKTLTEAMNTQIANVRKDMATTADLDAVSTRVDKVVNDLSSKATTLDVDTLKDTIGGVLSDIIDIDKQLDNTVKHCPSLSTPSNGILTVDPDANIPGSRATYSCKPKYRLSGDVVRVCLPDQTWSNSEPTCEPAPLPGVKAVDAEPSCRLLYERYMEYGLDAPSSGTFYINPRGYSAFQVYCDMDTPADPTGKVRGWTLCGKYDFALEGDKFLKNGFLRSMVVPEAMKNRGSFVGSTDKRWASIDCRTIIDGGRGNYAGADFMMHAGANATTAAISGKPVYNGILFTNVLGDTKKDATNLFDVVKEDTGQCLLRSQNAITTYSSTWIDLGNQGGWNGLSDGTCLVGDGHHFCSYDRDGSRFSNAGIPGCSGSRYDSIYWAWDDDDHGCQGRPYTIGSGCQIHDPTFQFNYLFVA